MTDGELVFHKTDLGAREIASAGRSLSLKLRRALILIDGSKTVGDLAPLFREGEIGSILAVLQAGGYIALRGGATPAHAAPAPGRATASLEDLRRLAIREIGDRLGPNGDTLALRIERCRDHGELEAVLREAERILATFLGAGHGRAFARKLGLEPGA